MRFPKPDEDILKGVIDMHVHAAPCLLDRPFDEIEMAREARDAGYRALVLKSIYTMNADRVQLVRQIVPDVELFGSVVFNQTSGGLSLSVMRAAIGFGAKVAWLPTVHAVNHVNFFGMATYPWHAKQGTQHKSLSEDKVDPICLLDDNGKLRSEAAEILELAKHADMVVGTGHIGADEIFAVLKHAKAIDFEKVVCTHVGWHATAWSREDMLSMADMGATLEFTINPTMPARQRADPKKFAEDILAVGAERCIIATDLGQYDNAHPVEGLRMFIRMLSNYGLSSQQIDLLARTNPARLLDLSDKGPDDTSRSSGRQQ